MTTQKAEGPRGGGGGGGRELLALADEIARLPGDAGLGYRTAWAKRLRTLATTLAAREDGWQPISTAPKDGTKMQHWTKLGNYKANVYWVNRIRGWSDIHWDDPPTHWQPLPKAPTAGEGQPQRARKWYDEGTPVDESTAINAVTPKDETP